MGSRTKVSGEVACQNRRKMFECVESVLHDFYNFSDHASRSDRKNVIRVFVKMPITRCQLHVSK